MLQIGRRRRIEVTGREGRRCKQTLDDLKEMKGYWKLKEEATDSSLYSTYLASSYGHVVRQTME